MATDTNTPLAVDATVAPNIANAKSAARAHCSNVFGVVAFMIPSNDELVADNIVSCLMIDEMRQDSSVQARVGCRTPCRSAQVAATTLAGYEAASERNVGHP